MSTDLTPPEPEKGDTDFTPDERRMFNRLLATSYSEIAGGIEDDAAFLKGRAYGTFVRGVWDGAFGEPVTPEALVQTVMAYTHSRRDGGF